MQGAATFNVLVSADRSDEAISLPAQTVDLLGVRFHALTEAQTVECVMARMRAGHGGWVVTPNLDHLRRLDRRVDLRKLYADASLVVPDGMPLIWASRLQGTPLPERVAGSSLIWSLSGAAAAEGRSVYLLGGSPGTADRAAQMLQSRYAGLRIAGSSCPAFEFESDPNQMACLIEGLRRAKPDIVYVGLGSPKQELLIRRVRQYLPGAWWLGIGISFSFIAGDVVRAPPWMQRIGLEWAHRLSQEPRRLFRRYVIEGLPFAIRLFMCSTKQRRHICRIRRNARLPGGAGSACRVIPVQGVSS